ncbi:ubiquinol-cytochrome c reductase iron-sulfur subunit [Agromyces soli]|uniref:Cytochrome bc1 complex Rieske iron-sulfur subunit n=1 Tax=Agromyces soli TaxID=659012 RepID=A0ABY4ATU3_9MICO|nr:Rieske (2Fe-2S) protein [Agromyces soli]UOE25278.1 Rieske (2Fe-2S) protein [Agromyces soli]
MSDSTRLSRRALIALGGSGGALALAACATGGPSGGTGDSGSTGGSGAAGGGSSGGESGAALAPGSELVKLADVPVGGSVSATVDGEALLVSQPTAGTVMAFSAICTHQQCVVAAAGAEFDCPCHGSKYDAATGDVLQGPALQPLTAIPVEVDGDRVVVSG